MHAIVLVLMGLLSSRLCILPTLVGTRLVPRLCAGAGRRLSTREDVEAYVRLGLLELVAFAELVRLYISSKPFQFLLRTALVGAVIVSIVGIVVLTMKGWIGYPPTGPRYSPTIASVS